MTKGRAALPATVVAEQDPFFIALGGPKAHDSSGRDDIGERAALPAIVVAEQDPLFIALGGPNAHDSSGRDDKGEGGASSNSSC
jgi:hypothetical protein